MSDEPVNFLQQLRSGGPWLLIAIEPDGRPVATTATNADEVRAFVRGYDRKRNLYYSVNPTRTAMSKKATKLDIAAIEFVLADLDPNDGETAEAAKARYLEKLNGAFEPKPTALVDSGNGLQCLWKLAKPIDISRYAPIQSDFNNKGKSKSDFAPEAARIVADAEARIAAVMERLGGKTGTQNIDRILRLPGTTNLPNAAKLKKGRVACSTTLLYFNDVAYGIEDFPLPSPQRDSGIPFLITQAMKSELVELGFIPAQIAELTPAEAWQILEVTKAESEPEPQPADDEWWSGEADEVERLIREGGEKPSRSEVVWKVINGLLRNGRAPESIVKILLDRANGISAHIYDQSKPIRYARKQVANAVAKIKLAVDKNGTPYNSQNNVRIALVKMGVTLRYNQFTDQIIIGGLAGFGPSLNDAAIDRLWLQIELRYGISPRKERFTTIVMDTARTNGFHPVRDYLDGLKWDRVKRIDKWLTTYGGAESNAYANAVGALWLMAAVRRIRQPGCKFDEMPIFEGDQGTERSTMLKTIAVKAEWFADDLPMLARGKEVIEMLRGKWIIESQEIKGLRRGEIEQVKSFMSRQSDRGRLAYDRITSDVPRQCVFAGTTNEVEYLKDNTGNRRYWPIRMGTIRLADLARDRDQIWAEAAAREKEDGASIRLARELWPAAAKEQEARLAADAYYELLQAAIGDLKDGSGKEVVSAKIASDTLWAILDVKPVQRTPDQSGRLTTAMVSLGWRRPNSKRLISISTTSKAVGYVKGERPWALVTYEADQYGQLRIQVGKADVKDDQEEMGLGKS
jgi:virulence-associated protein E